MAVRNGKEAAARATAKRAARMKREPAAGADDFGRVPMAKAAETAATVNKKEKEQGTGKKAGKGEKPGKAAADQKKKQRRGK